MYFRADTVKHGTHKGDRAEKVGVEAALPVLWVIFRNPIQRSQGTLVEHHAIQPAPFGQGQGDRFLT